MTAIAPSTRAAANRIRERVNARNGAHLRIAAAFAAPAMRGEYHTRKADVESSIMTLDPARTVTELEELRALTGDENGAQRVAWTETWEAARGWLRDKVSATGA